MQSDPLHASPPSRLLEVHEVAYLLKVSHETVLRFIRKGQLIAVRLGTRSWRVKQSDLDAYIDAQRVANGNGNGGPQQQGQRAREGDGA
jgi:excisionase family DNA binding protein